MLVVALAAVAAGAVSAAGSGHWPTASAGDRHDGDLENMPFCGTKQITLAVLDGFGINSWSQESYAAVRSEAAKCPNVKLIAARGRRRPAEDDLRRQLGGRPGRERDHDHPRLRQGRARRASRQATQPGVKVVPWGADRAAVDGKDYVAYVDWNDGYAGTMWANWMVKALHGKGNVIFTGGPAGNPVGAVSSKTIVAVFAKHPGMKLLTGTKDWPVTNWDPATAQKVDLGAARQVPEDRRHHRELRHGRPGERSVRSRRPGGSSSRSTDARRERALLPLQEEAAARRSRRSRIAELARPHRGPQGDRRGRRASEQRAEPISRCRSTRTRSAGKTFVCNPKAAPDFYLSDNISPAARSAKYGKP